MKRDIILFPCNGNAKEAFDALDEDWNVVAFVDDDPCKINSTFLGIPVLDRTAFEKFDKASVLAVPGAPNSFHLRAKLINSLGIAEERFATIIHPSACIGKNVRLGVNCLIQAGVVLTSNSDIKNHVVILPNTVVHHDSSIGDYSMLGSNVTVAGNTRIGRACYIGSGVSIINGVEIGDEALIGMGSVVIHSVLKQTKMVGVPAKAI